MLQIGGYIFMTFAKFIKTALEQTGLTKYKLAKRLGISQSTVANWIDGKTEPHGKYRGQVLTIFGVTDDDLNGDSIVVHYQEEQPTIPHAQFREILSEGGIRLLLDEDANVPDENIEDIIKYIRLRQGQVGR